MTAFAPTRAAGGYAARIWLTVGKEQPGRACARRELIGRRRAAAAHPCELAQFHDLLDGANQLTSGREARLRVPVPHSEREQRGHPRVREPRARGAGPARRDGRVRREVPDI